MSLSRYTLLRVPLSTAKVAHAVFPQGNIYLQMRDTLGDLYPHEMFAPVYAAEGQPGLARCQLALVSMLQFAENLSDRQVTEAVRARIDWKYVLGLDLKDQGFHLSVLSEFWARLIQGNMEQQLLDRFLER